MNFLNKVKYFFTMRKFEWRLMTTLRKSLVIGEVIMWLGVISYVITNQLWVLVIVPVYYIVGMYLLKSDFKRSIRRAHEEYKEHE